MVNQKNLALFRKDMDRALADSKYAFEVAVSFVARAMSLHDELETFYVPNMDFAGINARRDKILKRILDLAKEVE